MTEPGSASDNWDDLPSAFSYDGEYIDTLGLMTRRGAKRLEDHGVPNASNNAEWILCDAMDCGRLDLFLRSGEIPSVERAQKFWDNIHRRARREPLQYILGTTEFMSLSFYTPRGVFVPRPDTEALVELVEERLRRAPIEESLEVLDLCTGTGVISISLAARIPNLTALAVDASALAIQVTSMNAEWNNVQDRVDAVESSAASFLDPDEAICLAPGIPDVRPDAYAAILCNPPYVETDQVAALPPEVRDHEPREALDGGTDGLDFYRGVVPMMPYWLKPGGFAALEIGESQGPAVSRLMTEAGFSDVAVTPDYAGRDRVVSGVKPD
jgi:release factor glutamine methyltransferase